MKKTHVLVSLSVLVLILSLLLFMTTFYQIGRASNTPISEPITYQYIMKEYDGKIGIFQSQQQQPNQVLDVDISMLPELDRLALEQGIEIKNETELRRLVEDFDS